MSNSKIITLKNPKKIMARSTSRNMALKPKRGTKQQREERKEQAKAVAKLNKIRKWRKAKGYGCTTTLLSLID